MLDSNGTKLKPKKSQVHGMDIWARCHTNVHDVEFPIMP
jgi:hypothetical protein